MTFGESLGLFVLRVTTMLHSALADYVSVTNAVRGDAGSQLQFTVLPSGVDLAEVVAEIAHLYVGLLGAVAHIAGLGADLSKLFTILLY